MTVPSTTLHHCPVPRPRKAYRHARPAFTLVELLVSMTVAIVIIASLATILNQAGITIRTATSKMDAFQSAQAGFDIMTQRLSDATLNTYYDYDSPTKPTTYLRHSDLHFFIAQNGNIGQTLTPSANPNSGHSIYFQAPEGYSNGSAADANTQGLLDACGYFVEFGPESAYWPQLFSSGSVVQPRYRYRLMQAIQSTEYNGIYADKEPQSTAETAPVWITPLNQMALPIAENVIALIIWPREDPSTDPAGTALAPYYQYNSRQGFPLPSPSVDPVAGVQSEQLPPTLQITVVAIDENSAIRLQSGTTMPAAIEQALTNKFTDVTMYATDLAALESSLTANRVRYEVLTASITLRESKWSSGQ